MAASVGAQLGQLGNTVSGMSDVRGRVDPRLLCGAAIAWSLAVVSAGFWFPFYRTSVEVACVPGDRCTSVAGGEGTATLVGVNGPEVVLVLAVPTIVSVLVGAMVIAALNGSRLALRLAWAVVIALGLLSFVSGFSVGLWFLPSVALLVAAVALTGPFVAARHAAAPS
jgi:hypothetical protein